MDRGQRAAAALTDIREVEHSHFGRTLPSPEEPSVCAQHRELRRVVEELLLHAIKAHLSQSVGVLAADGPVGRNPATGISHRLAILRWLFDFGTLPAHSLVRVT